MQMCKLQFCTKPCQAEEYRFRLEMQKIRAGIYQGKGKWKYVKYIFVKQP